MVTAPLTFIQTAGLQQFFPVRYTRTIDYRTLSVKLVKCVNGPLVPVTFTMNAPVGVPGIVL